MQQLFKSVKILLNEIIVGLVLGVGFCSDDDVIHGLRIQLEVECAFVVGHLYWRLPLLQGTKSL